MADPNGNGKPDDNVLAAGTADFCIQLPAGTDSASVNVVGVNMTDAVFYDVRLLYDPSLAVTCPQTLVHS